MEEPTEVKEDDIELLSENIEYHKKLDFDAIIFRHIDRSNKMLSLGEPDAHGNCIAGLCAMLEWYYDEVCIKKLNKLAEDFNAKLAGIAGDKRQLTPTEQTLFARAEFEYVINKFGILVDLLGRKGKLWMKT